MAIERHAIPLLEYDSNPHALLEPTHEGFDMRLPERAVFAFLGDAVDRYAAEHGARVGEYFKTVTKKFPVYILERCGREICLAQAPLGAPAAAQFLDFLIGYGVKKIIAAGSCGVLEDMEENAFLIPVKALRDEGTSYHYLPAARFAETSETVNDAIRSVMLGKGIPFRECTTWTTDGFYRETKDKIALRRSEGCSTVEMECAALAACAAFRSAQFGQILYTADSLANAGAYEERGWGEATVDKALALCMEIAEKL